MKFKNFKEIFSNQYIIIIINLIVLIPLFWSKVFWIFTLTNLFWIFDYYLFYLILLFIINSIYVFNYKPFSNVDFDLYFIKNKWFFNSKYDIINNKTWEIDTSINYSELKNTWLSSDEYILNDNWDNLLIKKSDYKVVLKDTIIRLSTGYILLLIIISFWFFIGWTKISTDNLKNSYTSKYIQMEQDIRTFNEINEANIDIFITLENTRNEYIKIYWTESNIVKQIDKDILEIKSKIKFEKIEKIGNDTFEQDPFFY